jgi:hypothetical protein
MALVVKRLIIHAKIYYLGIFESCLFQMASVSSKEYSVHDCTPHGEIQTCIQRGSEGKNMFSNKLKLQWILNTDL